MTKIIFIRHAESDHSVRDDLIRPLTAEGTMAAERLPDIYREMPIDAFYSSPCKRAVDTIRPLAERHHGTIETRECFRERSIGGWIDDFFPFAEKQWRDFDFKNHDGESISDVQERYIPELYRVLEKHRDETVIIGTHGTVLCAVLRFFDDRIGYDYFLSMVDKTPYIVECRFEGCKYHFMEESFGNKTALPG